jgi:hypothetical protein
MDPITEPGRNSNPNGLAVIRSGTSWQSARCGAIPLLGYVLGREVMNQLLLQQHLSLLYTSGYLVSSTPRARSWGHAHQEMG